MKTKTYLRLSLLIPFFVWIICVLFFLFWSTLEPGGSEAMGSSPITAVILWTILFYLFGIIGWFLPYVLLSLILLIWSFRSRAQVLVKAFALSPVVMTILIVIMVNMLSLDGGNWEMFANNPAENFETFFGSNILFAILALFWGYICVGIGLGLYKFLQRRGFIKDEARVQPVPIVYTPS